MSTFSRYLEKQTLEDLDRKMVFLGGPRQVGKTTMAKSLLSGKSGYLNWDQPGHREQMLKGELPISNLLVFDELHKYRKWRGWIKGLFDTRSEGQRILVTGSARLDLYRYGGESLQGRYHFLRLHPLSVAELKIKTFKEFSDLLKLGGFPEPYFSGSEQESKRWTREYRTRLLQEDILSVEQVKDIGTMEMLVMRLPELVGSPLSINGLREDLQLNHKTADRWISILERMYAIFRIAPFGPARIRAVKKEQKHYQFDWTLVKTEGERFENLVACHLLKWVHFVQDTEGRDVELRFYRDAFKREVDFVLLEDGKPFQCIECKTSDRKPAEGLSYFKKNFPACDAVQLVAADFKPFVTPAGLKIMPTVPFLQGLI
ncbi:MAG: ATP-binding protein [Fibrobacterota bacterium]